MTWNTCRLGTFNVTDLVQFAIATRHDPFGERMIEVRCSLCPVESDTVPYACSIDTRGDAMRVPVQALSLRALHTRTAPLEKACRPLLWRTEGQTFYGEPDDLIGGPYGVSWDREHIDREV